MYRWAENGSSSVPKPSPILDPENPSLEGDRKPRDLAESGASVESTPPRSRRPFTASEKLRLLKAADAALATGERGALEALLRKEAIYSSHLSSWRQQVGARGAVGRTPQKPGRKATLDDKDRRLLAVENENASSSASCRSRRGSSHSKKAHEILGIALPEFDEESS